ncbi:hypothetical protein HN011_005679 [Eciton burchellii]|nr:hypothetical protein HN011_005679 [Eciton burchellii]
MAIIRIIYVITIVIYLLCLIFRRCSTTPRKIIIDTDAGGDDALAIMLALMYEAKTHDIEILAITTTYGNTYIENVEQNVLKILTVANRSDIPVYSGAQRPLIDSYESDNFFGFDGFGDFNFTKEIIATIQTKNASVLLADLVKQYPDEIILVSLAPLTNIAMTVLSEPHFLHLLKQHIIMGSSIKKNSDKLNQSDQIEFNFKQDPESNWIALNNINKPSTIVPIDTIHTNLISKEEYKYIYNQLDETITNFLYQAEKLALEKTITWEPSDGITMAIALRPDIITQSFETNLKPIIIGNKRGAVEIESKKVHNAAIVEDFNGTIFKNLLFEYLS